MKEKTIRFNTLKYFLSHERLIFIRVTVLIACLLGISLKSGWAHSETQKYENYLNSLKTLSGEFTQINSKGQKATGNIQISRPGKMRLTYDPPSSLLIVADGKWLVTYDKEADETNYVSLENTPATFILRPHIRFKGDVVVASIVPGRETTQISLARKEEPEAGYLTLVFKDNPIALKEWSVVDAQGIETRVMLSNIKLNVTLPPQLFMIKSPNLIQQIF